VVEDGAVVLHLGGRDLARRRIARVVEAAPIGRPRQRAGARARDLVGAILAGRDVAHPQHRFFAAVVGHAVGHQRAVIGREPPVERPRAVGAILIHVHQGAIVASRAVTDMKHGLVLLAVAARVKVAAPARSERARDGDADRTDLVELPEPLLQARPSGDAIQHPPRVGVLRVGPLPHLVRIGVLEPPVRIGDVDAVQVVDDVVLARDGGRGRLGGGHDRRQ
jgi:hypothetical protein